VTIQDAFAQAPLALAATAQAPASEPVFKRSLDVSVALVALVVGLPLLLLVALLIVLDWRGPIFFRQARVGRGGKPFSIFKFRTMHVLENGDRIDQAQKNDPRVTRVGCYLRAFSLDELPQLINVLSGDMSLVGPRPHARAHDEAFARAVGFYPQRRAVRPGLTGWAQVNGLRGPVPTTDVLRRRTELDLWYACHASLSLDLKILARTPREVLRRRNAF
jgi:lipopolysaccharide/colanic/teichoic acid biosynthesis glycosyltransferase